MVGLSFYDDGVISGIFEFRGKMAAHVTTGNQGFGPTSGPQSCYGGPSVTGSARPGQRTYSKDDLVLRIKRFGSWLRLRPKSPCTLFPFLLNSPYISLWYLQLRSCRSTNRPAGLFLPILRALPCFLVLLSATFCGTRYRYEPSQEKQRQWALFLAEPYRSNLAKRRSSGLRMGKPPHTWGSHRRGNTWWPCSCPNRMTSSPRDKLLAHFAAGTFIGIHNAGICRGLHDDCVIRAGVRARHRMRTLFAEILND